MDIRKLGGQADGFAEPEHLVPLLILLVNGEQHQYAIGHHLTVEMVKLLGGGQDGKAVVHRVGKARGVVHLHKVGNHAGGNDDAEHCLRQVGGHGVCFAVLKRLLSENFQRLCAHGA
ncbi:hypothetical protein SDC9_80207 [bioreactor metagenome]|uniref:Uncharacterized protein n=1 Tax=bioreactor metagenome TaxID=1076179 RepID=A0A644YYE1_9ZZZZ